MLKHKFIIILIIIVSTLILSIFIYRLNTRKILDVDIANIQIKKVDQYLNNAINEEKKKTILQDLDEYRYIVYSFEMKNMSDVFRIVNINIQPKFSTEMKSNVIWYDSTDAITDSQMCIESKKTKYYARIILIKKNGFSDNELTQMAKRDIFQITYDTFKGNSILSFWRSYTDVIYK